MIRRITTAALAVAAPLVVVVGMPQFSSATFTSSSSNTATVRAAADWTAPSVSVSDPGSPVTGSVTLAATASDGETGVASVELQYLAPGASSWTTVCTDSTAPYTCTWDTAPLADGGYSLRAVAVDNAGYSTTSATRSTTVTNTPVVEPAPVVTMVDPGSPLRGTVTVAATASATSGVASVRIERAVSGTGSWSTLCADTTAPYTCQWDTTTVADGLYSLRAVVVDGAGTTTTSTGVADRRVDNSPFRAVDVQATDGGATPGRIEAGDVLAFTFSRLVAPGSISPGWDGRPITVRMRVADGGAGGDTVDVLRDDLPVQLGSVNLRGDYIKAGKTVNLVATMTMSTSTLGGIPVSQVTITTTNVETGNGLLEAVTTSAAMVWTPSTAVRDLAGAALSGAAVTELGALDRDF